MARKHSTALFDVIHSAKKPPKASPSASIPTPKWWGKDKKLPKPTAKESTENAGTQQSWLSAAKKSAGLSGSATPAPAQQMDSGSASAPAWTPEPAIEPFYTEQSAEDVEISELDRSSEIEIPAAAEPAQPKVRFIDRFKNRPVQKEPKVEDVFIPPAIADEPVYVGGNEDPVKSEVLIEPKPDRVREEREVPFHLDTKAGEVRFNLSIGGIIALGFIILMALAIAFIAGTRTSSQALLNNDSSDMSGSPTTNPTGGMMVALEPAQTPADAPIVHPDVMQVLPKSAAPKVVAPTAPPVTSTPLPIKSTREIGMIYVVVQSYAEQDLAQRACDFMNKAGIPCTLVQGPDGWAPRDWFSVVGLQPFAKHDPGLAEYERAVRSAGARFTTKIMDQFQPQGYTWRETSDVSQQ